MDLGTPESAIISRRHIQRAHHPAARSRSRCAASATGRSAPTALLRRNMLIYGLGGLIAPFAGIKLIDLVVHNLWEPDSRARDGRAADSTTRRGGEGAVAATRSSSGWRQATGKTYRMLQDGGTPRLAAGRDAVIGYLEPHGAATRPRPRRRASRSCRAARCTTATPTSRRWTCRASCVRRPGSGAGRRAGAHERAGYGAREALGRTSRPSWTPASTSLSTVNVQHLESLNDQMAELTGDGRPRDAAGLRPRRRRSRSS